MELELIVSLSKQVSTVIFFGFFMIVLFRTYNKKNKTSIEEIKYSIFDEEELRRIR